MDLEYGIIGNCRSSALVHSDSSIDWLCFPRFDSPSVFAKLIDENKGGSFKIEPIGECRISQDYIKDSNVIETRFESDEWEFKVVDYFPHYNVGKGRLYKDPELHRLILVEKGRPEIRVIIDPRFDYAATKPGINIVENHIEFSGKGEKLYLYSNIDPKKILDAKGIPIEADSYLVLTYNKIKPIEDIAAIKRQMEKTVGYWKSWIGLAKLTNEYRDMVARSALALRLLTYDDSGAIIAASTTSIPEIIGGVRNWDYRYCWIRDASFTVMSLLNISRQDVAREFLGWILDVHKQYGINLQVLFGVNGERCIKEKTLDYLEGYKGSKPVRIGNAAASQRQIDIFGELLDAISLIYIEGKYNDMFNETDWELVYSLVETTIREWRSKDHSIWEFRTLSRHYTFSKVLCWVALDRGVGIAKRYNKRALARKWSRIRSEIRKDIMENGWNDKIKSFTQYYGSSELDASLLLLPYFGFISYKDPRMKGTIKAIGKQLFDGNFVMRYNAKDDFGVPKNALIACTFWYIEALFSIGKKEEAIKLFEKTVAHANHMGLLSEDINRKTFELLGNFPQAYSHIALINTATMLFGSE